MFRKKIVSVLFAMLLLVLALRFYRESLLSQIPATEKIMPLSVNMEKIPIPRRPGTQSIRIVGPPQTLLKFQIDFSKNPTILDWAYLERVDKRADVMVEGVIEVNGDFRISVVRDRGHPQARSYIESVLKTWRFKPYKVGKIRYYFNVPSRSENMKVQINTIGLNRNFKYVGPNHHIKTGVLCYADGINGDNILIN